MIRMPTDRIETGVLIRSGSFWIGLHYSKKNRRCCINLVPFITFWITLPGGYTP